MPIGASLAARFEVTGNTVTSLNISILVHSQTNQVRRDEDKEEEVREMGMGWGGLKDNP